MDALTLYAVTYLMVDVFCIIIGTGIIRKVGRSFGSESEAKSFKHFIGFYLLFCATDALLLPLNSGVLPPMPLANLLIGTASIVALGLTSACWFVYADIKMGLGRTLDARRYAYHAIPFAALVVLCVINLFEPVVFSVNDQGAMVDGPLYGLAFVLSLGYALEVTVSAWRAMRRESTRAKRVETRALMGFSLSPILTCTFDAFVRGTPAIAMGLLSSALFVFSTLQEARIFNDSLTGLNNRRRADQYLADKISDASKENAVYLYVLDVDLFKEINDNRGHIEGDRALRIVADGLRNAAGENNGFAARWGGDEFLLVVDGASKVAPGDVVGSIDRNLKSACDRAEVDYTISVSTGYAICTSPHDDPDQLLMQADRMLYDRKHHNRAA